jgi:hypothetical protein
MVSAMSKLHSKATADELERMVSAGQFQFHWHPPGPGGPNCT